MNIYDQDLLARALTRPTPTPQQPSKEGSKP